MRVYVCARVCVCAHRSLFGRLHGDAIKCSVQGFTLSPHLGQRLLMRILGVCVRRDSKTVDRRGFNQFTFRILRADVCTSRSMLDGMKTTHYDFP